jgi:hypothetical protein
MPAPRAEPAPPDVPAPSPEPAGDHDARDHFEPTHGPTAIEGHFLAHEPGAPPPEAPEARPPAADDVLVSRRIITSVDTVEVEARPRVITLTCAATGLLGILFFGRFVWAAVEVAGIVGAALGVVGIVLAALGVVRIWTGHWDGLIPAALLCLLALGGSVLLASAAAGEGGGLAFTPTVIALLAVDAFAVLFLILSAFLGICRDHLAG